MQHEISACGWKLKRILVDNKMQVQEKFPDHQSILQKMRLDAYINTCNHQSNTEPTTPNLTEHRPRTNPQVWFLWLLAQGRLQVCYGGPRDKDPGWPLSRPRVDIKSRPISEADPKITFQCLSKIVYLDYTRGGLTGGKKKDDSASHFNGWADHKSWPRSAYRVCFDVRLCLVGTVFIICGFFHIW